MSTSGLDSVEAPEGRVEDGRLLTGKGRFVDDLKLEGQAYMGFVRSPHAHARITRIDFSKAEASPEFISSMTGEDLLKAGVSPVSQSPWPFQKPAKRYHLAVGKVRFQGEPVAAILVKSRNSLEDLIESVEVEYEPLPAVTTIEESKRGETLLYEEWGANLSLTSKLKKGDAQRAIASAAHVIHAREGIARQVAAPIETHAVLVAYDSKGDFFDVWATVQSVHGTRDHLSEELGIPKEKFHVRVMDVGGGFGSKGAQSYPEAPIACLFAKRTGLPVKWTATRTEEFLEAAAGRDEYCDITLACDANGRIVALKASAECDCGVTGTLAHMPGLSLEVMSGPYRIPNQDLTVAVYATNKMPSGPVRGAGGPEGCYFIERAMDIMAKHIGMDPIELRRRNVSEDATSGGNFGLLLDTLVKGSSYEDLLRWRSDMYSNFKQAGPSKSSLIGGIGVSVTGSDDSEEEEERDWGHGQDEQQGEEWGGDSESSKGEEGGGGDWSHGSEEWERKGEDSEEEDIGFMSETARITLDKDGRITVYTGSSPHGQGEETTFAQLAAQEIGVPLTMVTVVWGDTVLIPVGVGTYGSRSAATGGSAVVDAARKFKSELLSKASEALGVDSGSLELREGIFVDKNHPEVALATPSEVMKGLKLDQISAKSLFTLQEMSYARGAHVCAITLDVELGKVKVVKYVVVEDCGRMINETIVEGQLHGGVMHAIGGALYERLAYDDQGNLLSSTFMDYNLPEAPDSPDVEVFHVGTPSPATLDGVRGVGESGTNGAYAAVINAVNDALSQIRPDLQLNVAPATPDRVFSVITQAIGGASAEQK